MKPPAEASQIDAAERELGCTFPQAYRQLLSVSNGRMPVNDRVLLYAAEELAERNRTLEVALYAPGWLMIGDDSGGRGFLIDRSGRNGRVLMIDHGSMVPADGYPVANSLVEWLAAGRPDEDEWQQVDGAAEQGVEADEAEQDGASQLIASVLRASPMWDENETPSAGLTVV